MEKKTKLGFVLFKHKKTGQYQVMLSKIINDKGSHNYVYNASEWERCCDVTVEGLSRLKEMTFAELQDALSEDDEE